eukprot:1144675-Pelagomonas_calceolata.AAC.4
MLESYDTSDEVAMPAQMLEVITSERAYRLQTLVKAYEAAKKAGIHATIQPPVQDTATEIMGLLSRQKAQQRHISAKSIKVYNFNMLIKPPHI